MTDLEGSPADIEETGESDIVDVFPSLIITVEGMVNGYIAADDED